MQQIAVYPAHPFTGVLDTIIEIRCYDQPNIRFSYLNRQLVEPLPFVIYPQEICANNSMGHSLAYKVPSKVFHREFVLSKRSVSVSQNTITQVHRILSNFSTSEVELIE